ncbi:DUF2380 domain-containing protein [Roseibium algae]|uniref:DUF2380 domain-containing protein n=1 Tax=Roseibium algae TaxID=3123038 RepID=UPI003BF4F2B9
MHGPLARWFAKFSKARVLNLVQPIISRERGAETEKGTFLYQTDIRGNTDDEWRRGLKWLMDKRVLVGQ